MFLVLHYIHTYEKGQPEAATLRSKQNEKCFLYAVTNHSGSDKTARWCPSEQGNPGNGRKAQSLLVFPSRN